MTINIKKTLTRSKLEKAEKLLIEEKSKQKGFDAKKFSGKLKDVFGDPLKYQKKLRNEF
jgi:hypothetical protein